MTEPSQTAERHLRWKAAQMLTLATLSWGLSFPLIKMINLLQLRALGQADSWFLTGAAVFFRFGACGLLMACFSWKSLRRISAREWQQGLGLGLFGGLGLLFQVD